MGKEEMSEEKSVLQIYISSILTIDYLWKKIALIIICRIHDYTRYKICRSFSDLFYWPDGFCADTVVIILFFTIGMLSIWDDANNIANCLKAIIDDLKFVWKTGLKLLDENEWNEDEWDDFE